MQEVRGFSGLVIFSISPQIYIPLVFGQVGSGNTDFQHAGGGPTLPGSWRCSLQENQNRQSGFPCKICELLEKNGNKGIGDAGSTADIRMLWPWSALVCLGLL